MRISVIVPVHNGGRIFRDCLAALQRTTYADWECVVVDDGSTDGSGAWAAAQGARVVQVTPKRGPAYARNCGAQTAVGDVLLFIDADVLVQPQTVGEVAAVMQAHPDVAALFGSYDAAPGQANFLSQYRNLQHHFVHQRSSPEASTFWSGCGAIRRSLFLEMGGFDTVTYPLPSIEDIELGYRLAAAGRRVRLEKTLQVRHMKRWTARSVLVTDIRDRALPWSRLILQRGRLPDDLNLQTTQRLSALGVLVALLGAAFSLVNAWALVLVCALVLLLLFLNRDFYGFLWHERGPLFLARAVLWHWLYFLYSAATFVLCACAYYLPRRSRQTQPDPGESLLPVAPLLPSHMETRLDS